MNKTAAPSAPEAVPGPQSTPEQRFTAPQMPYGVTPCVASGRWSMFRGRISEHFFESCGLDRAYPVISGRP
jgi:hypothetical protein